MITEFFKRDSAGGIVLMLATALALVVANSPLAPLYAQAFETPLAMTLGDIGLAKPVLLWINDGLMAVFFLLVGLELKREFLLGELKHRSQLVLPLVGALGGFAIPAIIYAAINAGDTAALNGWAIPSATDIAFALGMLALLGDRVPLALKVLLTSIAIIDDLAAITVIGIFYSGDLSTNAMVGAAACGVVLLAMNKLGVVRFFPYILVGVIMWVCVLKSGVHATLAGVALAFAIPLRVKASTTKAPLERMEHNLHYWVAFFILPLFAFANAGVSLNNAGLETLFNSVSLGIVAGLVIGKQLGVFGAIFLAVRFGLTTLPTGVSWLKIYGMSLLTGIGFTMSLFIGSLAFEHGNFDYFNATRIGVLAGSGICAIAGIAVLWLATRTSRSDPLSSAAIDE